MVYGVVYIPKNGETPQGHWLNFIIRQTVRNLHYFFNFEIAELLTNLSYLHREFATLPASRWASATLLWPLPPIHWSTDSRTCWLLPPSLVSNSRKLPHSKSSWLTPRNSLLLPPPLLQLLLKPQLLPLLLQPRRSLKKKKTMTWASVFSTKPLYRPRRSSSFCLFHPVKCWLARNILQVFSTTHGLIILD